MAKKRKKSPSLRSQDKFSSIPDALIHHIFSFMDMKHAVQTTVLSKRFRHIWVSQPTLNFNSDVFFCYRRGRMVRFMDFVDRVLILRDNSDVQRFNIIWHDVESDMLESRINVWVLGMLRRNVRELCIDVNVDMAYQFPSCLFDCKMLTKLELELGGKNHSKLILPKSIDLPLLVSLKLGSLSIDDVQLTSKLLSCPELESLVIKDCDIATDDLSNLCVSSIKMKQFELSNCGYLCTPEYNMAKIIKLNAPNLSSLTCKDYMSQDYSLENLSSLVIADIVMLLEEEDETPELYTKLSAEEKEVFAKRMMKFLWALCNVKELRLSSGLIEVMSAAPELLSCKNPKFYNLRCLKLEMWLTGDCLRALACLFRISPHIESLFLVLNKFNSENIEEDWNRGLLSPTVLSHLKFVEIKGVQGCDNELEIMEFLLKNAVVVEELVLFSRKENSSSGKLVRHLRKFYNKIRTLPRTSSSIAFFFF